MPFAYYFTMLCHTLQRSLQASLNNSNTSMRHLQYNIKILIHQHLDRLIEKFFLDMLRGFLSGQHARLVSSQHFTAYLLNIFKRVLRSEFSTSSRQLRKKATGNIDKNGGKIIAPQNCADSPDPILSVECKVAVITGGASGFGFAAADQLLCKGARGVVITDTDTRKGIEAAQRLCEMYGRERAKFVQCDMRNECQFEGVFLETLCKYPEIHIIFNDIDNLTPSNVCPRVCDDNPEAHWNNTARAIHIGMKYVGKHNSGPGGIIVNSTSILGFMGWPEDPCPVYCRNEDVIQITQELLKQYPLDRTGVRLVTLCPSNKEFEFIGLPYDPVEKVPNKPCIPNSKSRISTALSHVIAWAKTGSTWVLEPDPCLRELPRLIHFPEKSGKFDPKVYAETVTTAVIMYQSCRSQSP